MWNNIEGELKLEIGEEIATKHLSVSHKATYLGTNYIPQLFTGNLRPNVKFRETWKIEKDDRSPAFKKCLKVGTKKLWNMIIFYEHLEDSLAVTKNHTN